MSDTVAQTAAMIAQIMLSDIFAAVLAFATVVLVIVTALNMRETKKYGDSMTELVGATQGYVNATTQLVEETKGYRSAMTDLVEQTKGYVTVTTDLVNETREYAEATNKLVDAQAELVAAQTNPYVFIDTRWDAPHPNELKSSMTIFIKNIGRGTAYNITFHQETPQDTFTLWAIGEGKGTLYFTNLYLIQKGVEALAPDREMRLAFMSAKAVKQTSPIHIRLKYKNASGSELGGPFTLDFPAIMLSLKPEGEVFPPKEL